MKRIVKQTVGIDVAQAELVVCLGRMYDDLKPELYARKEFANTTKGFEDNISLSLSPPYLLAKTFKTLCVILPK